MITLEDHCVIKICPRGPVINNEHYMFWPERALFSSYPVDYLEINLKAKAFLFFPKEVAL